MSEKLINTRPALLLVDDDAEIRDQMKWALASDYQLLEASDRSTALAHVRQAMPQLVLLDLGLPPDTDGASEGLAILRETLDLNPMAKVIVVTGNSDRAKAVAAIESGAYDFIEKPVQLDVLEDRAPARGLPLQSRTGKSRASSNRPARMNLKALWGTVRGCRTCFA